VASRPMITITTISSTRVKPALWGALTLATRSLAA